jgi:hypothetical protein
MDFKQNRVLIPTAIPWYVCAGLTSISTILTETLLFPLESARIRLQVNGKYEYPAYNSLRNYFSQTVSKTGKANLYRGLGLTQLRDLAFIFPKAYSYEQVKRYFAADIEKVGYYRKVLPSLCATGFGLAACNFLDIMRIKYIAETSSNPEASVRDIWNKVAHTEGQGVMKGFGINLIRNSAYICMELAGYQQTKLFLTKQSKINHDSMMLHVVSSILASTAACIVTCPFDVIRTRFMSRVGEKNTFSGAGRCLLSIIKEDGFRTLYRGFTPLLAKSIPSSLVFFTLMENMKSTYTRSVSL